MNGKDLSTICNQARVDDRYSSRLSDILEDKGFLKLGNNYFKRVIDDSQSEYLFLDGIDAGDKFNGTYLFSVPTEKTGKFEKAVLKSRKTTDALEKITYFLVGTFPGVVASAFVNDLFNIHAHRSKVISNLIGVVMGGIALGMLYTKGIQYLRDKAAKKIDDYSSQHSDEPFNHKLLKSVIV